MNFKNAALATALLSATVAASSAQADSPTAPASAHQPIACWVHNAALPVVTHYQYWRLNDGYFYYLPNNAMVVYTITAGYCPAGYQSAYGTLRPY